MNKIDTMKRIIFFLGLIIAAGCTQAQTGSQPAITPTPPQKTAPVPPKLNIENIPHFKILTQDSVYVTNANLKKNKPVVIIYFAPDCSHCQHLMYEMKPDMKKFEGAQIVMVTFTQVKMLKMLKEFYRDFDLKDHPNFMIGTEFPDYVVQRYYQVQTTPYIAVYDRKGKLVKAFEKAPTMPDLEAAVKKAS
jgi:thiol-disulfide isomerase/thioredoxin